MVGFGIVIQSTLDNLHPDYLHTFEFSVWHGFDANKLNLYTLHTFAQKLLWKLTFRLFKSTILSFLLKNQHSSEVDSLSCAFDYLWMQVKVVEIDLPFPQPIIHNPSFQILHSNRDLQLHVYFFNCKSNVKSQLNDQIVISNKQESLGL